jgi:drug/metabolite transporter (DMT)-like permease
MRCTARLRFQKDFPCASGALWRLIAVEAQISASRSLYVKNTVAITVVVLSNSFGNLLLAMGTNNLPQFQLGSLLSYVAAMLLDPWLVAGTVLMIVFMISQLALFSWADLSYVVPITGSSYVITAILSIVVLHESIAVTRWAGIVLISFGVVLVSETPPHEEQQVRRRYP